MCGATSVIMEITMTAEEARAVLRKQIRTNAVVGLESLVAPPHRISIIVRERGNIEETITAWIVGEERPHGYKIIMREDGSEFGLATDGFPEDAHPVLVGWYGDLKSAVLAL
jgi:hypothetical protein